MKKVICKILDLLIKLIELFEDKTKGFHVNLDNHKYMVWDYVLKDNFKLKKL